MCILFVFKQDHVKTEVSRHHCGIADFFRSLAPE